VSTATTRRRYAIAIMAREILRDAAHALTSHGIPVMPLKGVLFQQVLYADPAERLVSDVDVLVPEREFWRAVSVLLRAGFRPEKAGRSLVEVSLRSDKGLSIDLHRRLFSPGRYALSTASVFRRAHVDAQLCGVPLHIAHPHDTAAHLVGKVVSDHVTRELDARLGELLRWCEHCAIEPVRWARHLSKAGLARAARYTLELGLEHTQAHFFRATLDALPNDGIGRLCARAARDLIPRLSATSFAAVPAHMLNASLLRGGASAAASALNRLRHARLALPGAPKEGLWAPFFQNPA
jgi:hypothetical protein